RRWGLAAAVEDERTFLALGWRVGGYVELVQCIDGTLTVLASRQEFDAAHQRAAMRPLSLSVYPKRGGGLLVSGWAYPDVRVSATVEDDAADRFVLAAGAGIWCLQGSAYLGPIAIWRV